MNTEVNEVQAAAKIEMNTLQFPERTRKIYYSNGSAILLHNVIAVLARPDGSIRLKTGDGRLHIIAAGWNHIEIDADDYTL